ncbi:O-antigen ligase family protein [Arenimonas caeni]|nr:O-antigen ligase family protein [Arenimonas caeni]
MLSHDLSARIQLPLAAAVLAGALVLGGGQGTPGDSAVQVLAQGLLALCLWRHGTGTGARLPRASWLAGLVLALPLLQLLPIPDALWLMPEARTGIAAELSAAGVDVPSRWSLVPLATERALHWLLPAVALFLAALQMEAAQRNTLLKLVVLGAAASVVLGLAQLAGGTESALRFYTITNPTEAVGFFANRNHLASLLAVALPLVVVGTARWLAKRDEMDARTLLGLVAGIGLVALLILGIAITLSRAGIVLGMVGLLISLPIVLGLRRRRRAGRALAAAVALGLTLAVQFALFGILQRLEKDPLEDARFQYLPVVESVAREHWPLGAGLGGFRRAFEAEDPSPIEPYVNHAHNDWAEVWLEAGWPGWALIGGAVAALLVSGWRVWRPGRSASPGQTAIARAAWLGLLLLALHSLGDYPLRKTAMLAVAGVLAGCVAGRAGREKAGLPGPGPARSLDPAFNP